MEIQPNSTIILYGDLGLTPNSEDTRYFDSESAKNTWFNSQTPIATLQNNTYSRRGRGVVRISSLIRDVYNVCYMRFRNINFENKWFCAFVTEVEYINNQTTDIHYEIDVMTTWMGDFNIMPCYVVRQHSSSDVIGANTVDENLDVGEYVCEGTSQTAFFGSYKVGMWRSMPRDYDVTGTGIDTKRQGTYVPVIASFHDIDDDGAGLRTLTALLTVLTNQNKIDTIIGMKLVPEHYCNTSGATLGFDTFTVDKPYSNFLANNNYKPKNNKLYTYPYKYLSVENCEGSNVKYRYEYFNTVPPVADISGSSYNPCTFRIRGSAITPEINIMCFPHNYLNKSWDYSNAVEMTKFPSIAWNVDAYKAYIAQRDSTIAGDVIGSSLASGTSSFLMSGFNPMSGFMGLAGGAMSGMTKSGVLSDVVNELTGSSTYRMPNETRGTMNTDIMVQSRQKNFYFRKMCITPERMRMIDDYFTMYGYAVKKVITPVINVRPAYTYVKTIACKISPKQNVSIPGSDMSIIEHMFDDGKRFWRASATVGDYTVNNQVAS